MGAGGLQTCGSFSLHEAFMQAATFHRCRAPVGRGRAGVSSLARWLHYGRCMDALYVGIAVAFFLCSWGLVVACDRLS